VLAPAPGDPVEPAPPAVEPTAGAQEPAPPQEPAAVAAPGQTAAEETCAVPSG